MKRLFPILCFSLVAVSALANDQLREVQTELKSQGFYYGDITGNESTELTAAIRRYQIRNGLEVTGTLTGPTLRALDIEGAPAKAETKKPDPATRPPSAPPKTTAAPSPATKPPVHLRREQNTESDDRRFLEQDTNRRSYGTDRSVIRPPAPLDGNPVESSDKYADVFAGTPYETAPPELQEQTVRRAQMFLTERGYYAAGIDGDPGPATEEAILAFQRSNRLRLTGRLDLQTLSQLRLLPGRGSGNPALRPFNSTRDRSSNRVYRGIWVE